METINLIFNIINWCWEHVLELLKHVIYTTISLFVIFWTKKKIGVLIDKYRTNKFGKGGDYSPNNLKVEFTYNGNDVKLDLINFDGYNYIFKLGIDAFRALPGQTLVGSRVEFTPYLIHMSSEEITTVDIFKIMFCKKVKLSKKTSSNIVRVLTNHEKIK